MEKLLLSFIARARLARANGGLCYFQLLNWAVAGVGAAAAYHVAELVFVEFSYRFLVEGKRFVEGDALLFHNQLRLL